MSLAHSAALGAYVVGAAPFYLARAARGRNLEAIAERLGLGAAAARLADAATGPRLHLHACSVGEVAAAEPFAAAWRTVRPDLPPFVTTTTETGQAAARARFPDVPVGYLPFDFSTLLGRVLGGIDVRLLVLVETEIWPNLIERTGDRGASVAVASGRISDRAWPRYRLAAPFLCSTFGRIDLVCAQSERDAERFAALGAPRVETTGNVKFDAPLPPPVSPPPAGRVFVAGSVHPPEFAAVADAVRAARAADPSIRAVVAPRHLERAGEAEEALRRAGLGVERRSHLADPAAWRAPVLLLDVMGELGRWYGVAEAAFVGGTIAPVGGHNLIEPAAAGCAVLHGPRVEAQREAIAALSEGRLEVTAGTLADRLARLLAEPGAARALGARARAAVDRHRGAARRTAERIAGLLR